MVLPSRTSHRLPGITEDPFTVFAVRDANADNLHVMGQWQAMGQAQGMDDFIDAHRRFNAMPGSTLSQ